MHCKSPATSSVGSKFAVQVSKIVGADMVKQGWFGAGGNQIQSIGNGFVAVRARGFEIPILAGVIFNASQWC